MHKKCRKTSCFLQKNKNVKTYLWMNKYSELCSWFLNHIPLSLRLHHECDPFMPSPLKLVSSLVLVTNPEPQIVNPSDIKAGKIRHLLGKWIIPCQKKIGSNNSHPPEIVVIKLVLFSPLTTPVPETENSFLAPTRSSGSQTVRLSVHLSVCDIVEFFTQSSCSRLGVS